MITYHEVTTIIMAALTRAIPKTTLVIFHSFSFRIFQVPLFAGGMENPLIMKADYALRNQV